MQRPTAYDPAFVARASRAADPAQIALLFWQPVLWWYGEPLTGIGVALVVADIVALMWLVTNPRLRACFVPQDD